VPLLPPAQRTARPYTRRVAQAVAEPASSSAKRASSCSPHDGARPACVYEPAGALLAGRDMPFCCSDRGLRERRQSSGRPGGHGAGAGAAALVR